jgi:DNA polymerase II small subunit
VRAWTATPSSARFCEIEDVARWRARVATFFASARHGVKPVLREGMMRELIDYAAQRGALLHPEVLRWLQADPQPLDALQRALPDGQLPPVLTVALLQGQRGAVAMRMSPSAGLGGAVVAAMAPVAPRAALPMPVLPVRPGVSPAGPTYPAQMHEVPLLPLMPPAPARPPGLSMEAMVAHGIPGAQPLPMVSAPQVEVLKDITGKSTCTGELADFTRYFNDRLRTMRRLLRQRRELAGVVPIDRVSFHQNAEVKLIGMVSDVRTTKNGYRILELEDETGSVPLLVPKNDHRDIELGEDPERVLQDEVLGVVARVQAGKDILYLKQMFRPDVELNRVPHRAPEPALACFISDVHFGAKTFLSPDWDRFVRWLQGKEGDASSREKASRVKFLVVAGDMVDGIGVYPGQEHELAIPDIEGQYAFAAKEFAKIPDRVRIVMLPGNHDAVRPAEPQPAMGDKLRQGFKPNVTFVGNPCAVSLMGVEVLAYHGVSLIDYITSLRGLDVHKPIRIMEEIMRRRHIAPMYGGTTPVAPEPRDYMLIERVPDIFVTGHLHTCDMGDYRGVTLINAGTWQAQTSYQKTLGIVPEPARVATVDLSTGKGGVLRFDGAAA